jgi:OHCU decarboxylase
MRLDELNTMDAAGAEAALLRCCGSTRWARRMAESRPFADVAGIGAAADRAFDILDRGDWLEAFAAHPKIGAAADASQGWAGREQGGVARSPDATRRRLDEANRHYEARFGYIFIVCATGKSGDEMLELLERRLANDPPAELTIAAREQRAITQLRLLKLLDDERGQNR